MEKQGRELVYSCEVTGDLDQHIAEALWLEIRRLAKRCDLDVKGFRVEVLEEESSA